VKVKVIFRSFVIHKKKNIKKDEYEQKWNEYLGLVNFGGVFLGLRNEQVELYLNFNQLKRA